MSIDFQGRIKLIFHFSHTNLHILLFLPQAAVQRIKSKQSSPTNDVISCQKHDVTGSRDTSILGSNLWQQSLTARIGEKAPDCLLCELGSQFEKEKASKEKVLNNMWHGVGVSTLGCHSRCSVGNCLPCPGDHLGSVLRLKRVAGTGSDLL